MTPETSSNRFCRATGRLQRNGVFYRGGAGCGYPDGEELTVLFGKIKKRFSTYDADGDGVVDEAEKSVKCSHPEKCRGRSCSHVRWKRSGHLAAYLPPLWGAFGENRESS